MTQFSNRIKTSFSDKEYRHAYANEFLNTFIATQIKVLRKQCGKSKQRDLAREAGMKQSAISRLEDINYSSWSLSTLKRLAYAFDLRLKVSFESFGSLISDFERFDENSPQRAYFDIDPVFSRAATPVATREGSNLVSIDTKDTNFRIAVETRNIPGTIRPTPAQATVGNIPPPSSKDTSERLYVSR